jgi:hypothetical protein
MNMRTALVAAIAALALIGCANNPPIILPAAGAPTVPGRNDAAVAESNGIRQVVYTDAWQGTPRDLGLLITPLDVTLENHSNHAIRIEYRSFALKTAGYTAEAISPYQIQRPGAEVVKPFYWGDGFLVAPPYAGFYPGYPPFVGPFSWAPYGTWQPPLPTPDMIARGIPEGVLNDGGHVRGFLYFPRVPAAPEVALDFVSSLPDAQTNAVVSTLSIPLIANP